MTGPGSGGRRGHRHDRGQGRRRGRRRRLPRQRRARVLDAFAPPRRVGAGSGRGCRGCGRRGPRGGGRRARVGLVHRRRRLLVRDAQPDGAGFRRRSLDAVGDVGGREDGRTGGARSPAARIGRDRAAPPAGSPGAGSGVSPWPTCWAARSGSPRAGRARRPEPRSSYVALGHLLSVDAAASLVRVTQVLHPDPDDAASGRRSPRSPRRARRSRTCTLELGRMAGRPGRHRGRPTGRAGRRMARGIRASRKRRGS